ncbi:MAG TPA: hypothetical protein VFT65_16125 [Candidatus Angelobacter sp.]|nr:hypothetical protein [Candidatus Angelobacter sp.]
MPRWIAFDQQTSSLLQATLAQGATIQTFGRGAIDYALAKPGAVVTLLPAAGSNSDIGIAVFRGPKTRRPARPRDAFKANPASAHTLSTNSEFAKPLPGRTMAGGFLGLRDEVVLDDELEQEKKGWWRRFWDE